MKRGDLFALGEKGGSTMLLLCEFRDVKDGVIHGTVTHGGWSFYLEGTKLRVHGKRMVLEREIIWTGRIPKGVDDAFKYVNSRISRWKITNYLIDTKIGMACEWARFVRALGAAKRAFCKVYGANSQFVRDEEDLIPF